MAQLTPDGDWKTWLILAGRGFGKTRTGAEWVREQVRRGVKRIGLIAPTIADARDIMVEGESGLLSVCGSGDTLYDGNKLLGRPKHEPARRRVRWRNGAVAMLFSAEEPERLRGPQHEILWCDELAAWRNGRRTWDMAVFGLRLGKRPRACVTTTPKPIKLIRELAAAPDTALTRGTTLDNRTHLAPGFVEAVRRRYGRTALGRQEIEGEIVNETEGALWKRATIETARGTVPADLVRVVVAVDPPASSGKRSDACGIVVAGIDAEGTGWVIADASLERAQPEQWARAAVECYRLHEADRIVAEVNQGGDMVAAVMRNIDPAVPVKSVRATRGKQIRAEPVAMLYAQGRVRHARAMPALEDEMCAFKNGALEGGKSPDRLDALVWALTELMLGGKATPRVRGFG
jgi:phage terminase large subunit-like protein